MDLLCSSREAGREASRSKRPRGKYWRTESLRGASCSSAARGVSRGREHLGGGPGGACVLVAISSEEHYVWIHLESVHRITSEREYGQETFFDQTFAKTLSQDQLILLGAHDEGNLDAIASPIQPALQGRPRRSAQSESLPARPEDDRRQWLGGRPLTRP